MTARLSAPEVSATPAGACNCQAQCIRRIVGSCYDECNDRCEGDTDALGICQRGCRNAQCMRLENACMAGSDGATNAFQLCCTSCGTPPSCDNAVDCEVTTTSTSTTRTTTTETVSTTTVTSTTTSTT